MSCTGAGTCNCSCCSGTSVQTPQVGGNRPGLSTVSYRVGSWATFKESMLARLSSSDYPALTALKTRADDDFTIAFLDATSVVFDVLTFYQERLANESYLGTAGQLRSLIEMSRLIGYQPAPGVAAECFVAFTLKTAPGQAPDPSAAAITIPQGTQMQSVPAQGQKPQTFETSADIPAKPDWNELLVQGAVPWVPPGPNYLYLAGVTNQLSPGDALLILGADRENWNPSDTTPNEQWIVGILNTVVIDKVRNSTYVSWDVVNHATSGSAGTWTSAKVFALRQRAALFGNNAPDPNLFVSATDNTKTSLPGLIDATTAGAWTWKKYTIVSSSQIDLDAQFPKIVVGSWFALIANNQAQLYKVITASSLSRSAFGLSGKVTELAPDFNDPNIKTTFPLQATAVSAQSEQLTVAEQLFPYPLYGTSVDLQDLRPDLAQATVIAISGKQQKLSARAEGLQFQPDDTTAGAKDLNPGDVLTLTDPKPILNVTTDQWTSGSTDLTLRVQDSSGRPGTVMADVTDFVLASSGKSDPVVSECAVVLSVTQVSDPYPHTVITLKTPLQNCYDRKTTTVNANVVMATNGQSVSEVLGNGSASTPNQSFVLKQFPITYVQAPTPTGRESTLEVQISGVKWKEVPTLFEQKPSAQVFTTLNQSDGTTEVIFGDGVEGATLPTGQNNLQANYRTGSGAAGNVGAGTLTTLVDRPLGVSGVTNPQTATGGQDAQTIDDVRSNAPQTVLTLGRAVSIADYQSYASIFAGISKAYAIWIPSGPGRGVFLTVAGVNGQALSASDPTLGNLITSLRSFGNPLIPVTVQSFLETLFQLSADVKYDPAYDQPTVQAGVLDALSTTYSFANRTFGEGVSADEVASVMQSVPGVVAVNVKTLTRGATSTAGDLAGGGTFSIARLNAWLAQRETSFTPPFSDSPTRICAYVPVPSLTSVPFPAEILVLDPDPSAVTLGVMS